jgi:hypothetical protein
MPDLHLYSLLASAYVNTYKYPFLMYLATISGNMPCSQYMPKKALLFMIEINPITNKIKDLRERAVELRGYL